MSVSALQHNKVPGGRGGGYGATVHSKMSADNSARRLKMEAVGTGKSVEIVAKGKCRDFPCKVDGWRCPVCTKSLSDAYIKIIGEYYDAYQNDVEELKTRRRQV